MIIIETMVTIVKKQSRITNRSKRMKYFFEIISLFVQVASNTVFFPFAIALKPLCSARHRFLTSSSECQRARSSACSNQFMSAVLRRSFLAGQRRTLRLPKRGLQSMARIPYRLFVHFVTYFILKRKLKNSSLHSSLSNFGHFAHLFRECPRFGIVGIPIKQNAMIKDFCFQELQQVQTM